MARTALRLLLLPAVAMLMVAPASGQEDPCVPDALRLCPNVPLGGGDMVKCLKAQEPALSPACRQKLLTPQQVAEEVVAECSSDAAKFCQGVPAGSGRISACLRNNLFMVSAPCQTALWAAREKAGEVQQVCGSDIANFCAGMPAGQGRIVKCLQGNMPFLSPACKALLSP